MRSCARRIVSAAGQCCRSAIAQNQNQKELTILQRSSSSLHLKQNPLTMPACAAAASSLLAMQPPPLTRWLKPSCRTQKLLWLVYAGIDIKTIFVFYLLCRAEDCVGDGAQRRGSSAYLDAQDQYRVSVSSDFTAAGSKRHRCDDAGE